MSGLEGRLDTMLRAAVDAGDVPGVAVMVCDRRGTLYEGAAGVRTLGVPGAMGTDTVAWIASLTKAITCAAALRELDHGRLALDEPAARWLPDLGTVQVLEGFGADGSPQLRPPKRPITLRHLITHTAGFGYDMWNAPIARYLKATGLPTNGSGRLRALQAPLLFDPGERWQYGINIDWVGRLVEAASGQKLSAYLRTHLLEPLRMHDTAFRLTPAMRARLAKIHQRDADGTLRPTDTEIPQDPEFEMGGGGLYGTAADYLKFLAMVLNEGHGPDGPVLSPRVIAWMRANAIGDLLVQPLRAVLTQRSNDAEFFPGLPKRWSLAFQVNETAAPTGRAAGTLMWAGLANCYYWIDPASELAGVYVTQVLPFADRKALPLFYDVERAAYQAFRPSH
jgi:methyl acetate hydrolase